MSLPVRLSDLDARTQTMIRLILRNRQAITEPSRGILELKFHGRHVEMSLVVRERLALEVDDGPQDAA